MNRIRSPFLLLAAIVGVFSILAGCSSGGGGGDDDDTLLGPSPVNLGAAGGYAILAKTAVTNTPASAITGDIGVSPAAETVITGFAQARDPSDTFSTSPQVTGKIYAADMAAPTPANLTAAVADMMNAYADAAGRTTPDGLDVGAGNIGGLTLTPGLYKWGTALLIPTSVTLSGNGVWIFQIAGTLTVGNAVNIILSDGAQAGNIVWQVSGAVGLGTTSQFKGTILGGTAITIGTGTTLNGRALAQSAVSLSSNTITKP